MKVILVKYDDWEGLYFGDDLVLDGHHIRPIDVFHCLQNESMLEEVDIIEIDNKIMAKLGYSLPNDLNDVKSSL